MANRVRVKTVTFKNPFELKGYAEVLPAGDYQVETEEEPLMGLTFVGYRRILTLLHLHPASKNEKFGSTLTIDPNDLDTAYFNDLASNDAATK